MSKVKCPNCGAKNSKERMTCVECGTSLTSEQVERQLSQVSTEVEVSDKTVIEKEAEERVEDKYRDNEKVLYKTRGWLTLPYKEPEKVDCFVTERHVVIEAKELIKIPVSQVQDCVLEEPSAFYFTSTGTATLTFLDDLNKKHKLSLEIAAVDLGYFKQALAEHVEVPMDTHGKLTEKFRDKMRDDICAGLRALGVDAKMAVRGRAEEHSSAGTFSLGVIDIPEGPIRWVNVYRVEGDRRTGPPEYYTEYGVPDPRLNMNSPWTEIKSVRKKNFPLVGKVVDLHWEGKDNGLGIILRLNSDTSIKEPIMKSGDVKISNHRYLRCWIISPSVVVSRQPWNCYQRIAKHLLSAPL